MTARHFSPKDIERRVGLWEALANFYLDTESDTFVPLAVEAARAGGFTLEEVEDILRWEVRPALYTNLISVAGLWSGWDRDWLVERIVDVASRPPNPLTGPLTGPLIGHNRFMPVEWPALQAAIAPS